MKKFRFQLIIVSIIGLSFNLYSDEIGNWKKGFFTDEFGDRTNKGFISNTTKGKFSNTATEGSPLRVVLYINNGDITDNLAWLRLYEYDGRNPVKGIYRKNGMTCRIKNEDDTVSSLTFLQSQGENYFYISDTRKSVKKFKEIVKNENKATFSCLEDHYGSSRYIFRFDFAHYHNVLKQFNAEL